MDPTVPELRTKESGARSHQSSGKQETVPRIRSGAAQNKPLRFKSMMNPDPDASVSR